MWNKVLPCALFLIAALLINLVADGVVIGILSAVSVAFSLGSILLFLHLALRRGRAFHPPDHSTLVKIILSQVLAGLAIYGFWFSYWILVEHFSVIICRTSPCTVGVYGWSAALLSFTVSCNLFLISLLFLKK